MPDLTQVTSTQAVRRSSAAAPASQPHADAPRSAVVASRRLLAVAAAAIIVTVLLASRLGAPLDWRLAVGIAAGLVGAAAASRWPARRVLATIVIATIFGAGVLLWRGALPVRPYGDGELLAAFLQQSYNFPRWLLGMTVANALYAGVWQFPPVAAALPASVAGAGAFAAILCLASMAVATVALLDRWNRLPVHCALLTPVWLLFASGYVEYYPLIVGGWVAALAWTFERPLHQRSPLAVGALVGLLPALYIAFAGLAALLAVTYTVQRPRRALAMTAAAAATLAFIITLAYPTIPDFLHQLYGEMNFGDRHSDPRYAGLAASPTSLLLATRYVLRPFHLQDVWYMLFWGGGWLALPLLVLLAARAGSPPWRDDRLWLAIGLVAFYGGYLLWMIPKKGPQGDVDLFSPVFLLFAFLAGLLAERTRWHDAVLAAFIGVDAVTVTYLIWAGLPAA